MRERPIIFSAPMVRALIGQGKTQTRRPINSSNSLRDGYPWSLKNTPWEFHDWSNATVDPGPSPAGNPGPYLQLPFYPDGPPFNGECDSCHRIYSRIQVGDKLWVRETYLIELPPDYMYDAEGLSHGQWPAYLYVQSIIRYKATTLPALFAPRAWKSPLFMPSWASRITLEIAEVRVQRLGDITEEDATAEGFTGREDFLSYWDWLYRGRLDLQRRETWVWALTFKVL